MPTLAPAVAALQHTLDVAQIFKENSVIKQGLPEKPARLVVGVAEANAGQTAPPQAPTAPTQSVLSGWAKTAAVAAGSALLGGGLPWLAATLWPSVQPTQPVTRPPAVSPASADVSLLQDLQERGFHLPLKRGNE